jgi:hypothetical protein
VKPSAVAVGLPKVGVRAAFDSTTIENDEVVATVVLVSVMRAVMAKVPVTVGVPEITPVEVLSVTPAGSDPDGREKVPEPDPPLVERESE